MQIDLITRDEQRNEIVLIIVDDRPWDGSRDRLEELQQRVNDYLGFALDGDLRQKFPETSGLPFRLQLDTSAQPDAKTTGFIEELNHAIAQYGTRLEVNVR